MNESQETIKKVAAEGLEARNLVNWIADGSLDVVKTAAKPPASPRPQSISPKPKSAESAKDMDPRILLKTKRRGALSRPKSRLRSASAGRNPEKDLRARYWTFLFENLHRAVDEIYQTCEMDESIVESKEAIMMLENYSKDFHSLIQYINISKNYEKTAPVNRPTSLAWEVRKSSPGKSLLKNVFIEKLTAGNSQAKRILCFDTSNDSKNISDNETVAIKNEPKPTVLSLDDEGKPIDKDSDKSNMDCSDASLSRKECGITISVVPETNEVFPCNDGLIVKEICFLSNDVLTEKPTVIIEAESENANIDSEDTSLVPSNDKSTVDSPLECNENSEKHVIPIEMTEKSNIEKDKQDVSSEAETISEKKENAVDSIEIKVCKIKSDIDKTQPKNEESLNKPTSDQESSLSSSVEKKLTPESSNKPTSDQESSLSSSAEKKLTPESSNKPTSDQESSLSSSAEKKPTPESSNKPTSDQESSLSSSAEKKPTPVKRKVLIKKSTKVNTERVGSAHSSCKQNTSSEEKSNLKSSSKSLSSNLNPKSLTTKTSTKENETNVEKRIDNTVKNAGISSVVKKTNTKTFAEKSAMTNTNKSVGSKPFSAVRKIPPKVDTPEERKVTKTYSRPSAIQRNISYVSSLSSKNQLEKAANEEKKKPIRAISHAMKLPQKSGSMSSLHKISVAHRWNDKASSVEQIPEIVKSNTDEDSDGWETVRGRNRCRNSPAKKIPFSSEKNNKALDFAKLNQSRFGGFPYTTKGSTKSVQTKTTPKAGDKITNQEKNSKNESPVSAKPADLPKHAHSASKQLKLNGNNGENNELKNKAAESESKKTSESESISKDDKLINELLAELKLSEEVYNKIKSNIFISNQLTKSSSVPCLFREFNKSTFSLSKTKSLSEQSLNMKKYTKIKHSSRNSIEKNFGCVKKKNRKSSSKLHDDNEADSALNTSLDESDTGLTSDDQDGQTSHDEAYDAQCQDLCDTAWKYKILEQQVHKLELSWGEQMDRFDMELRTPGRALEMHEKLSSPFRKKSLMESIRLQEEKQVKAREQRERLLEEKLQKIKEIEKKRQEMRALVEQRQEKQRVLMEQKLQRAEEKRKKQLQMIIRKAHDEEEKVNEIAFINTLEAQNKRHDLISKEKDHEARLHDIQEERQRKQEEKAAKEAAAEERRKLLEAERQARLNEMQEKRKIRDHKVEQLFLVKEKERQELASQKARDREQRLSALNAQQQNTIEELQKKIQLKQEESARRHEENMEQIRQKAFELSIRRCSSNNDDAPQPVPYETKKICTLCNVLIGSEVYLLSHLRGKKHQETVKDQYQGKDPSAEELELYNLKHIVDASTDQLDPNIALDKERQKALKKRCKKLRQRMSNRGQEYESQLEKSADTVNSNVKSKMTKITSDIKKLITTYEKSSNDNNLLSSLERCLNEIENVLEKKLYQDKVAFRMVGGLSALIDIFKLVCLPVEKSAFLHKKIINHLSNTAESIVEKCHENCLYILFSNKIGCLLDLLIQRLNVLIPNNYNQMIANTSKSPGLNIQVDLTAGKLMHFLSSIMSVLAMKQTQLYQVNGDNTNQKENQSNEFQFRVQDVISYTVSIGIVDKLSQYFNSIQSPIGNEAEVANFLLDCVAFLTSLIKLYSDCFTSSSNSKTDDSTQLIAAIKVTNMVGSVSLLYGLLLHSGVSSRGETPPPQLPKQIESLVISTLCMLNNMAVMNLQAFQTILGSEGVSLQLRHISSHLLWYCSHWTSDVLLHEVILLVGYFTVLNVDNQSLIQAGQRPTVLSQLCSLPFLYFSDSELTDILFPTLIACCYNNSSNKTILEQEMSSELLSNYIEVKYMNNEEFSSKPKNVVPEKRWIFSTRFPKNCWSSAKHYFAVAK